MTATREIKVLFDEQIFLMQEFGGISRYFVELIKQFEEHPELGIEPILNMDKAVNNLIIANYPPNRIKKIRPGLQQYLSLMRAAIKRRPLTPGVDIVHWTFYAPGFRSRFKAIPKAVTLYDMIPELVGGRGKFGNPHLLKRKFIQAANIIFSISNCSTQDMNQHYGLRSEAVTTYLGVGKEFFGPAERPSWLKGEFFLYVGQRDGYKDIETAYRAFSRIENKNFKLLVVGGGALKNWEVALLENLGVLDRVSQADVVSDELPGVYRHAVALLFPSNYEGFGFPPVEAMAAGTVALVADTKISKEIYKDGVSYFPAKNHEALANLMTLVAKSPEKFEHLKAKGISIASEYTWFECAKQTAKGYRELMSENKGALR